MAGMEESSASAAERPPRDLSFEDTIKYAFNYQRDPKFRESKDSEHIAAFLNFLREIWRYLTDSAMYPGLGGERGETVVPFMHEAARELVATNILKFLDKHREDLSPVSKESEAPTSALSNAAQGHLTTCFKLISSFIMHDGDPEDAMVEPVANLVRVFMKLVPDAIDLSVLLDLMTDLVKVGAAHAQTLSTESTSEFVEFFVGETQYFVDNFYELEMRQNKRLLQTCGAKLIGVVKLLETNLERALDWEDCSNALNLRLLLTQCLPASHLGISNRQSITSDPVPVVKMSPEEWTKVENIALRARASSIPDYEVASYEAVAAAPPAKFTTGQVYDIKAYLAKTGGQLADAAGKGDKGVVRSVKLPPYEVYSNFCDIYEFMQNPEIVRLTHPQILLKTQDYVEDLQKWFNNVLAYVGTLADAAEHADAILGLEFNSGMCDFVARSTDLRFWSGFLIFASLALQSLRLFHRKPDESTTYDLLKEKVGAAHAQVVAALDNIDKNLWATILKVDNLWQIAAATLQREEHWVGGRATQINWKLNGCADEPAPTEEATLEPVEGDWDVDEESEEEEPDDEMKVLNTLRELEKISYELGDKDSTIGVNFVPKVPNMKLNSESIEWYIPDTKDVSNVRRPNAQMTCDEQLACKFEDYCKKLEMDEDPANDIAEEEKSKHDPLFRFRFIRLFGMFHAEKYMEMTNEDIASGNLEAMLRVVRGTYNKNPEKKEESDGSSLEEAAEEATEEPAEEGEAAPAPRKPKRKEERRKDDPDREHAGKKHKREK